MSIEQHQRSVNTLDKDLATLEKKKSDVDKKCADLQSNVYFSKKEYNIQNFCLYGIE